MPPDLLGSLVPGAPYRISVERYHRMIDAGVLDDAERVELLEGVIVAVSPQSPEHAWAVTELDRMLQARLDERWRVRCQMPLTLARSEPEPDLAVVHRDELAACPRHPRTAALVVEVARASLAADRALGAVYADAGVLEYWVVDVEHRRVERFAALAGASYGRADVLGEGDVVRIEGLAVEIPVSALFRPRRH